MSTQRTHQQLRSGWCHCMASTYGSWLPGDPRGFRTRDHREHVEGDYKSPPQQDYSRRHAVARQRMTRHAVILSPSARSVVLQSILYTLTEVHDIELLCLAVSANHFHLLGHFPPLQEPTDCIRGLRATDPVRHFIGIAKKESAKKLVDRGLASPGGIWARKGKIVRIHDRRHQLRVYHYILAHRKEGAAVWNLMEKGAKRD